MPPEGEGHEHSWEVEAGTAGPHLAVEARLCGGWGRGWVRKQRSGARPGLRRGREGPGPGGHTLLPHALLMSLTPAGDAFAGSQAGGRVTSAAPSANPACREWLHGHPVHLVAGGGGPV